MPISQTVVKFERQFATTNTPPTMPKPLLTSLDLRRYLNSDAADQTSPLLILPKKLIKKIFRHVQHPKDQIAFILTCKTAGAITARIKPHKTEVVTQYFGSQYRQPYVQLDLLKALKKWKWIPKNLQLCHACVRYLPKKKIWRTRSGKAIRKLKYVDWMWAVHQWTRGGKLCPICQIGDLKEGKEWLQGWGEGVATGPLRRQEVDVHTVLTDKSDCDDKYD